MPLRVSGLVQESGRGGRCSEMREAGRGIIPRGREIIPRGQPFPARDFFFLSVGCRVGLQVVAGIRFSANPGFVVAPHFSDYSGEKTEDKGVRSSIKPSCQPGR